MKGGDIAGEILKSAEAAGLRMEPGQVAAMGEHFGLLRRWNRAVGLTSVRSPEAAAVLYTEPVQVLDLLPAGARKRIVDVGSGAGFPGLILALLRPDSRVLLVERAARKAAFLAEAVRRLGLKNVEILERDLRSAEDLPAECGIDVLTLKAVRAFGLALELLARRGNAGSIAILFTGGEGLSQVEGMIPDYRGGLQLSEVRPISGRERSFALVLERAIP